MTNKFGSVDVEVEKDDVKVTNDGTTITAKSELKNKFSQYKNQLGEMTRNISEDSAPDDPENDSSSNNEVNTDKSDDASKADGQGNGNKANQVFDDHEMIVAALVDDAKASSTLGKINLIKSTIQKDQSSDPKKIPTDDYINGFYRDKNSVNIAYNLSTSSYKKYYLNDDSDRIKVKWGGPGRENMPSMYKSKKDLMKKYGAYKEDIDQILRGIQYNKSHSKEVFQRLTNGQ